VANVYIYIYIYKRILIHSIRNFAYTYTQAHIVFLNIHTNTYNFLGIQKKKQLFAKVSMFAVIKEGKPHTIHLLLFPRCARGISPTRCYPTKLGNMTSLSESFAKTETERFVNESELRRVCQKKAIQQHNIF